MSGPTKSSPRKLLSQKASAGQRGLRPSSHGEVGRRNPATLVTRTLKRCYSVVPSRSIEKPNKNEAASRSTIEADDGTHLSCRRRRPAPVSRTAGPRRGRAKQCLHDQRTPAGRGGRASPVPCQEQGRDFRAGRGRGLAEPSPLISAENPFRGCSRKQTTK